MAYVCPEWFPNEKHPEKSGFYMDNYLRAQIDVMVKNVIKDWDFTILISGQGEMRVGKSLIGLQIGAYWTYELQRLYGFQIPFNVQENLVMNGRDLIKKGMALGNKYKFAAINYDEAADDMETTKVMTGAAQQVKDYLRKAAQFNMLNIIVQSEFFEVPKPIAISRSSCLIDVSYSSDEYGNFQRGTFRFFSRRNKKRLYLLGKKMLDYNTVKPDFVGYFPNFYPVDEQEYRAEKRKSLMSWNKATQLEVKRKEWLIGCFKYLHENGLSYREIAEIISERCKIKISYRTIGGYLNRESIDEDEITE